MNTVDSVKDQIRAGTTLEELRHAVQMLPEAPEATPIPESVGEALESAGPANTGGGGGGLSLGDESVVTITSSDGVFTWQVTARAATLADNTVIQLAVVG